MTNTWQYRENVYQMDVDLGSFDVEATDGGIGTVDEEAAGSDYVVVDTGFWIFGTRRLIPAGVIDRIDYDNRTVHLGMTKDQVKDAPDLDESLDRSSESWARDSYDTYYQQFGW